MIYYFRNRAVGLLFPCAQSSCKTVCFHAILYRPNVLAREQQTLETQLEGVKHFNTRQKQKEQEYYLYELTCELNIGEGVT